MPSPTCIEPLEARRFLDSTLSNGVLTVLGTSADDVVTFQRKFSDGVHQIVVNINNDDDTWNRSDVHVILVDVGFGNDSVILGNVDIRAQIKGGRGDDSLSGGVGRDTLYGGPANDYLYGGPGNDVFIPAGEADEIIGGDGSRDLVDYSERINDLRIDIDNDQGDDGELGEGDSVYSDIEIVQGGAGDDQIGVESGKQVTLTGGAGDDTLTGGLAANVFDGGPGNDHVFGYAGNDLFWMEDDQRDTIEGGPGDDSGDVDNDLDIVTSVENNI
ncbi:MAG TPA: hypothetical protein VGR35_07855 [Tepidisphaeraceae bacterium]|nr:hypothetical protein [Tepidisphaeraceae bacterium]